MAISLFDMLKIGIGPSSSHTVGPMRAARRFASQLRSEGGLACTRRVSCHLYGSLGATGVGHGTGPAVLMGLEGHEPETIDPDSVTERVAAIYHQGLLNLAGEQKIDFSDTADLLYIPLESLPEHPNGMRLRAFSEGGDVLLDKAYYSIGGGFVLDEEEIGQPAANEQNEWPYPFASADELLLLCKQNGLRISELMLENEKVLRPDHEVRQGILAFWQVMQGCVQRGLTQEGILPGGLKVKRRAAAMHRKLIEESGRVNNHHLAAMDWVNLYALAVNEENAGGGRIVTAPTNGAAGIIPAVLHYYVNFCDGADEEGVIRFLLTASAIGALIKMNASISGAEVGCQGEVGSACAMAAAGLAEVLGATPEQVENAAEIGMEHNLGLTCDPIGGLVQVPCIERNAMAAVKAINAASIAMRGDGEHFVSLDSVIRTMRETGKDMMDKYKETSRGGLAVNVIEC
ncbi:L-serine ammonia-lyase [Photobacterium proteolyticum]|uniref:L-serine dehydratase n=1 Tax=Photobacterium proteolyticum TaxID=1903952 RepID=A0A1Q9G6B6_9GAMM|nr:L-serine ammonia-lyase [Photobacterium proteolyticum]OLQ69511.1 L-serine ammonia-lyase [Photobacterium proteolyticum]